MNSSDPIFPPDNRDTPLSGEEPPPAPAPLGPALPDDLRVPWNWTDVLIFIVFSLGVMVVLEYTMQTVMLTTGRVKMHDLPAFLSTSTVYVAVRQALWFASLLVFLFFTLRPRRAAPFWDTVGWCPPQVGVLSRVTFYPLCLVAGAALALVIAFASNLMAPKEPLPIQAFFHDRQSIYLMAVMAVLVAPIVEETVFRGFLYPVFARSLGMGGGIALTGIFFGLMHAQQLWGGWAQIALLVVVGVLFTLARARTGSVITSYLLHFGYNAIQFIGFFFSDQFHRLPLIR
ncbi:MAG: CPBP family intramembrane metalloprotease [Acidobacteria bacterium]|nr:CPBP family intramembrane metalloprotease [Acidobacteriota bacterium]